MAQNGDVTVDCPGDVTRRGDVSVSVARRLSSGGTVRAGPPPRLEICVFTVHLSIACKALSEKFSLVPVPGPRPPPAVGQSGAASGHRTPVIGRPAQTRAFPGAVQRARASRDVLYGGVFQYIYLSVAGDSSSWRVETTSPPARGAEVKTGAGFRHTTRFFPLNI